MAMDRQVLDKLISLSETGAVALMHIVIQTEQGSFGDTAELFRDFMEAFAEMEEALLSNLPSASYPQLSILTETLKKFFVRLVECYESGDDAGFVCEMNENVFRIYGDWQKALLELE